jgi:hypothetical protein
MFPSAQEIKENRIKEAQDALKELFPGARKGIVWEEDEDTLLEQEKEEKNNG